jgi:hypothetical protein
MVGQKDARSYTSLSHDIHERNQHFLEVVSEQYLWLCEHEPNWQRLDVTDEQGELLSREVIHNQILTILAERHLIEA